MVNECSALLIFWDYNTSPTALVRQGAVCCADAAAVVPVLVSQVSVTTDVTVAVVSLHAGWCVAAVIATRRSVHQHITLATDLVLSLVGLCSTTVVVSVEGVPSMAATAEVPGRLVRVVARRGCSSEGRQQENYKAELQHQASSVRHNEGLY